VDFRLLQSPAIRTAFSQCTPHSSISFIPPLVPSSPLHEVVYKRHAAVEFLKSSTGAALNVRQSHSLHCWSSEHGSSCALQGTVAVICFAFPVSSNQGNCVECETDCGNRAGIARVAACCASRFASELLLVRRQLPCCRHGCRLLFLISVLFQNKCYISL